MMSNAPSWNYLPLDATGSPAHKGHVSFLSVCVFTDREQEIQREPEIAYHINGGALIFKRNVLVLQTLHGHRQTDREKETL